uniref:CFAP97 domain containing 2 n=1 Tax=Sparus aurata TaxID=8175 RepID=A0A671U421_SPAAU
MFCLDRPGTHLAYQPLLPTTNKYLQRKWDRAAYDLHRTTVKSAKPTIDTTAPKTYAHLALNLKKLQIDAERTIKIQRENELNLEKINHIMRTTGEVDNRRYYDRKSLGKERRQQELLHITKENQMIQFRLSHCRSHYGARNLHEDWLKTLKVMTRIAHYPRRSANQLKGKRSTLHTQSTSSDKANGKAESEENVKREEANKTESTGREIQQNIAPEPSVPDKSISSGTPEKPGSSDTYST